MGGCVYYGWCTMVYYGGLVFYGGYYMYGILLWVLYGMAWYGGRKLANATSLKIRAEANFSRDRPTIVRSREAR